MFLLVSNKTSVALMVEIDERQVRWGHTPTQIIKTVSAFLGRTCFWKFIIWCTLNGFWITVMYSTECYLPRKYFTIPSNGCWWSCFPGHLPLSLTDVLARFNSWWGHNCLKSTTNLGVIESIERYRKYSNFKGARDPSSSPSQGAWGISGFKKVKGHANIVFSPGRAGTLAVTPSSWCSVAVGPDWIAMVKYG